MSLAKLALHTTLAILSVFAPIQAVLTTVLVLVLGEFVTGVWAAFKRGEKITSKGFRRSALKFAAYEVALLLGFLAETYLIGPSIPVVKLLGSLIGLSELKSILENLNSLSGDSLFKQIIDRLSGPKVEK
jgi:hypothetical protein